MVATALAAPAPSAAQATATVRGTVVDAQNAAIPGAGIDVVCGTAQRRTRTNAAGQFSLSGLPAAACSVTATSDRFEPLTRDVNLQAGDAVVALELQVQAFTADVLVTPSRGSEQGAAGLAESTSVTTRAEIDSRPYTLLAQVLREEPGIYVQQTTSAQVSPIIRGFTGQSNVYLVDGVRYNQAAWRSGPSQYLSWIEGAAIDRIEVVRGAGSVQYGSDALGGTFNLMSAPPLFSRDRLQTAGNAEVFFGSGDESAGAQGEVSFRTSRATLQVGGSGRRVGDLRAGGGLDSHSALTRYFDLPSTVLYSRQPDTDFRQGGAFAIANLNAGRAASVRALFMHEDQNGASRYDRVLGGQGVYRSGFDPQRLDFGFVRYQNANVPGLDGVSATVSLNRQADGRFEQSRPTSNLDTQNATTRTFGYQLQGQRSVGSRQFLVFGTDIYRESITDANRAIITQAGVSTPNRPDIPNGTGYNSAGVFLQDTFDVLPNLLQLKGGLRFDRFGFSTVEDRALGVTAENVTQQAFTFQTAAVVRLADGLNATVNVTKGLRAANSADLGSVGLSGGGGFSIAPTTAAALGGQVGTTAAAGAVSTGALVPDLGPEQVYQYEVGLKASTSRFGGSVSVFNMEFQDFIERRAIVFPAGIVGSTISGFDVVRQDATGLAYIAQDVRPIVTTVNAGRARIKGFDVNGDVRLTSSLRASAYASVSTGRLLESDQFVRRMPPPMGGANLRWTGQRAWVEGVLTFALEQTQLNSGDLSDARIGGVRTRASIATFFNGTATDLGLVQNGILLETGETLAQVQTRVLGTANSGQLFTSQAGYAVFSLRGGLDLTPQIGITVLGENLGDVNYRHYGSGVDAPGANVQVRARVRF